MIELLVALFLCSAVALAWRLRATRAAGTSGGPAQPPREATASAGRGAAIEFRQSPWTPWAAGAAVALGAGALGGAATGIALALGAMAAAGVVVARAWRRSRRTTRIQLQLADAIDLLVGTLRAGGSLTEGLNSAAAESREPFKRTAGELVHRVRLGDDPLVVLAELESRIPLESFRLFSFTLAAHWNGGGSLAATIATVGRTIRDRVAVTRRVQAQAIESQVSALGVLAVTYLLAWMMWRTYPERMEAFTTSEIGGALIALAIALQAAGLLWISRLTRIEV